MERQYVRGKSADKCKGSLADSVLLLKTSSRSYIPFVELGETSEYYHHDMYHLLASRGIESLNRIERLERSGFNDIMPSPVKQDIIKIYGNMIAAYKAAGLKEGYILTTLNYLEWRRNADRYAVPSKIQEGLPGLTEDTFLAALNTLKSKFASEPVSAEVYLAQAATPLRKNSKSMPCNSVMRQFAFIRITTG